MDKLNGFTVFEQLSEMSNQMKKLSGFSAIQQLAERTNPMRKYMESHNSFFDIASTLGSYSEKRNNWNYIFNTSSYDRILGFQDSYRIQSGYQNLFNGSAVSLALNQIKYTDRYKTLGAISAITTMQSTITEHLTSYNYQLKLTEKITQAFANTLSVSQSINSLFNSANFTQERNLSNFDVLSGATFYKTWNQFQKNSVNADETYSEIEKNLDDNLDLKYEIIKLQATLISLQNTSKQGTEKWHKTIDPLYYMEWFMNKILIRKLKLSPLVARLLIGLIMLSIKVTYDVLSEAKGNDVYDYARGNSEASKQQIPLAIINNYVQAPQEIKDFTIKKTAIYNRSSTKTKKNGTLQSGASVLIIKIIDGWCFVEGQVSIIKKDTRKNRKKYKHLEIKQIVRGWVKKENLDMFQ
jgi:hypothetical protein